MARTVSVILDAIVTSYNSKMKQAAASTEEVATAAESAGKAVDDNVKKSKSLGDALKGMGNSAKREFEVMQDTALANEQAWSGVQNQIALVGAAAAAVSGLAVREFASFDQAMSGVASTGADAKDNIESLRQAAIDMGADTAFSAVEAAQGVEELARAGVDAASVLGGGLSGALDLAAAGQIGVAEAAGIAATAMTQFKLRGDEIPHLADLLAAGAGKAMGGVDDLGQALQQSGLVASQFGLSIEETVGGLSAFAAAGLLGSDAGTSMKSMLLALANPAGKTAQKMQELGIEAYNAQGQFIGLEGLAGVLQDRLAGLTDAQRQQALAQIFGTDAIRAASILYENGAEGIREWTEAVNDSGYAAETAAELQNNLIGDLEKLGGSWSTLAIEMGESADGPLRLATQALTGLLDVAGQSPAISGGIMLTATALGGLALGAAGLMKGISTFAAFQTNLANLTALNPRIGQTATVIGKVGKAAGIAAVAFAAVMAAKGVINMLDGTATSADEAANALERVKHGVGDLDTVFQTTGGGTLVAYVDSLGSAMERYADRGWKYMDGLDGFMSGITGQASDIGQIATQFGHLDTALSGMDASEAAAQFEMIRTQAVLAGLSMEDLIALMPTYSGAFQQAAAEAGEPIIGTMDLIRLMSGEAATGLHVVGEAWSAYGEYPPQVAAALEAAAAAEEERAGATDTGTAATEAAEEALKEYNDLLDATRAALDTATAAAQANGNAMLALSGSQIGLEAAIDAATKSLQDHGKTLDIDTEAGRANKQALDTLAAGGQKQIEILQAQNATNEEMVAASEKARKAYVDTATAMGMSADEAEVLAAAYFAIPSEVATWLETQGLDIAHADLDGWERALDQLSEEEKTKFLALLDGASAATVAAALEELARPRNAVINVSERVVGGAATPTMGRVIRSATGGYIRGPGTPTSDSIPAMLSDREFVLRAAAVRKIGVERLHHMNATGTIPGFRNGGQVGVPAHATAGSFSASHRGTPAAPAASVTYIDVSSREGLQLLASTLRDSDRLRYKHEGVH